MRKLALIVLIAAMQLLVAGVVLNLDIIKNVEAQAYPEIFIEPSTYIATSIGEVFNVSVNIRNITANDRMIVAQFRVQYNESLLEVINVIEGPFMKQFNNTAEELTTGFIVFIEDDPIYGPMVLVGIVLEPNATGSWTNFPEGEGIFATITFRAKSQLWWQPLSCDLTLNDTLLVNDSVDYIVDPDEVIPHTLTHGHYQMQPKSLIITYSPSKPSAGEIVIFEAPEYEYPGYTILYCWDFGDGSAINTTGPSTHHIYALPRDYNVSLICIGNDNQSNATSVIVPVGFYVPLEVKIDVGSLHFRGEIVEFNVLITHFGKTINATKIEAIMYYDGGVYADLSASVQYVDTGFYRISYSIPADAETGEYPLIVKAEYYDVEGTGIKSFQISPMLTSWGNSITEIENGIATVSNGLTEVKINLTAINAKLVNIEGKIGIINSTLGTLRTDIVKLNATLSNLIVNSKREILANVTTSLNTLTVKLDAIDAKIVGVNGTVATLSTTLGEANVKLGDVQSLATTALYVTSILSAIAVILAAAILIFIRKK
jgi:hypothetical protein